MQPSTSSVERMKQDMRELEENDAVREYRFITQQINAEFESASDPTSVMNTGNI